jgi:hypothetical protein
MAVTALLMLAATTVLRAQGVSITTTSDQTALFVNTDINNATVPSLLVHGYSPVAAISAVNSNPLGTGVFGSTAGTGVYGQGGITGIRGYGTQYGVRGESSGGYAGFFSATGANTTNIGLFASASGGTNNIAAIFGTGNVGVGTSIPGAKLHVNGTDLRSGVFNSIYSGAAEVLRSEYTGSTSADGIGVFGRYQPSPFYGIGGHFEGGWKGVEGIAATSSASGSRAGVTGDARGGQNGNYGVAGYAYGSEPNYGVFGYAAGGSLNYAGYFSGDLAYTGSLIHSSDMQFKKNVTTLADMLPKVMQLKPRAYEFLPSIEYKHMNFAEGKHFGLIAQEVEKIFPELVADASHPGARVEGHGKENGPEIKYKGVKYMELIPILISAMQSQQREIEQLRQRVNELSSRK